MLGEVDFESRLQERRVMDSESGDNDIRQGIRMQRDKESATSGIFIRKRATYYETIPIKQRNQLKQKTMTVCALRGFYTQCSNPINFIYAMPLFLTTARMTTNYTSTCNNYLRHVYRRTLLFVTMDTGSHK